MIPYNESSQVLGGGNILGMSSKKPQNAIHINTDSEDRCDMYPQGGIPQQDHDHDEESSDSSE